MKVFNSAERNLTIQDLIEDVIIFMVRIEDGEFENDDQIQDARDQLTEDYKDYVLTKKA